MLQVSDKFKEAIKSDVREIKAYLSLYDKQLNVARANNLDTTTAFNIDGDFADITNTIQSNIMDILRPIDYDKNNPGFLKTTHIEYKYASLEKDYFKLDGTYTLPNRTLNNTRYIGDINSSSFLVKSTDYSETKYNYYLYQKIDENDENITIVFDNEEYAVDFDVILYPAHSIASIPTKDDPIEFNIRNNTKTEYTITFSLPLYNGIAGIEINVINWSNPEHRVKIKEIIAGKKKNIYQNDIINMNLLEQTSIDNKQLPSNSFSCTVNNYNHNFDVTNENGMYNFMYNNDIKAIGYLGCLLDSGNIEYVSLGTYLFEKYKNNSDLTTNIDFTTYVQKIFEDKKDLNFWQYVSNTTEIDYIFDHIVDGNIENPKITSIGDLTNFEKSTSYENQTLEMAVVSESYIKQLRKSYYTSLLSKGSTIMLETFNSNYVDILNLKDIINYPRIQIKEKINKVINKFDSFDTSYTGSLETLMTIENITPIFRNNSYYYDFENYFNEPLKTVSNLGIMNVLFYFDNDTSTGTGGNRSYYNNNHYYTTVEVGRSSTFNKLTVKGYKIPFKEMQLISTDDNIKNGKAIELNINLIRTQSDLDRVAQNIFNLQRNYDIEVECVGLPQLEVGDDILVENIDGYQDMIIEEISLTYDGGLRSTLKGRSNNYIEEEANV